MDVRAGSIDAQRSAGPLTRSFFVELRNMNSEMEANHGSGRCLLVVRARIELRARSLEAARRRARREQGALRQPVLRQDAAVPLGAVRPVGRVALVVVSLVGDDARR